MYGVGFCKYISENNLPPMWNVQTLSGDKVLTVLMSKQLSMIRERSEQTECVIFINSYDL